MCWPMHNGMASIESGVELPCFEILQHRGITNMYKQAQSNIPSIPKERDPECAYAMQAS